MRTTLRWLLLILLLISGGSWLSAQSTNSGDIRGTVTDATGAVVPGVNVTVMDLDTGVAKSYSTNHDGIYDTNSIVPGSYRVIFEKDGFDTLVRGPITLQVGFTTVNGVLKVGSIKEQVVVTTDVPLLSTESGEQSTTLDAKSMDELPQVTQTWENFVQLLPGAAGAAGMGSGVNGAASPGQIAAINGNLPYSSFLADGVSTTLGQSMNTNPITFENVAELQVSTSTFSAQYGVGGAIFNQITKSGTGTYHGTAYDFLQNQALGTAYSYNFGDTSGVLPKLRYNNFGGSIGGPVYKVKRAFFYFNYDHIIDNGSNGGSGKYTIPTNEMMNGDFSSIQTSAQLYDPTTQTFATDSNGNRYPIRSAYGNNTIPSSELSTVAKNFMKWYPTLGNINNNNISYGKFICVTAQEAADYPTAASGLPTCSTGSHGEPIDNWASAPPTHRPTIRYFGRLDYDITPQNRLTLSDNESDSSSLTNSSGVSPEIIGNEGTTYQNNNAQITDVWTINSHIVNEARLGYTFQKSAQGDTSFGHGLPAQLGWKFAKGDDFPDIDFTDGDWTPAWINKQDNGGNLYNEHVFDPSDVVTLIAGKHILHFGGEVLIHRDDSFLWGGGHQSGQFFFGSANYAGIDNNYTANWAVNGAGAASIDSSTGWAISDFMLGYAAGWGASETPEFGARLKSPQFFVQDDYKVTPTLTLNLGLRYQMNLGWNEVHKDINSFDPTVKNTDGTLGAMWFASTGANGRTAMESNVYNIVLPRAGFSWLLDPKTTLRGGFGLYSYDWSLDNYGGSSDGGIGAALGGTGSISDATGGLEPITLLDGTGTNYQTGAALPYSESSTAPDSKNGSTAMYTPYHSKVPSIVQWNLSAQREISPNIAVELAYVASHGYNLVFGSSSVNILNEIPASAILSTGINTAAIPYPNFGSITGFYDNAISNYNSLQAQITRRMSNGLSFNFNYVWSHMLDDLDSSGWGSHAGPANFQSAYNVSANYANSNFDVRNAFKGNVVYQLPFGKGKTYLHSGKALDEAVGGWEVSGSVVLSSGHPFTVTDAADHVTNANGGGAFPNWNPGVSPYPTHRTVYNWINPGAFVRPADGTFGNVHRNSLIGPGVNVVNISAHKEFDLAELWNHDIKLQFRADAQNAFNHPSFDVPGNGSDVTGANAAGMAYTGTSAGTGKSITSVTVAGRTMQFALRVNF